MLGYFREYNNMTADTNMILLAPAKFLSNILLPGILPAIEIIKYTNTVVSFIFDNLYSKLM